MNSHLPYKMRLLPLYGAGFDNLGPPITIPTPSPGPDELLVRHDAVGLCGSDCHVIHAGENHPSIYREMRAWPVVLGHEVALTVVDVGRNLRGQYRVGQRYVVQADIFVGGVRTAYGYELQGGLAQFNILDRRVLDGDGGCYLLPLKPTTGYAQAALTEPRACVEAAYSIRYRTCWEEGGTVLIAGPGEATGWDEWRPGKIYLSGVSPSLAERLRDRFAGAGVEVREDDGEAVFDDILVLGSDVCTIGAAAPRLAKGGILCVATDKSLDRPVAFDVARLHYDHITLVGTRGTDVRTAYREIRTTLRESGATWVLGASGPSGQMHVVRAIEIGPRPRLVAATNLRSVRIREVAERFGSVAAAKGVELLCLTEQQLGTSAFHQCLWTMTQGRGFDDIVVLAAGAVGTAIDFLAPGGVLNLYAGIPRGTMVPIDFDHIVRRGVRIIGSSGSTIADMQRVLALAERNVISTNRWVAAIGSLDAAADGLRAVSEGRFSGKVVIYPYIPRLPLMSLADLKDVLPDVYAKLTDGRTWTVEAERELLRSTRDSGGT